MKGIIITLLSSLFFSLLVIGCSHETPHDAATATSATTSTSAPKPAAPSPADARAIIAASADLGDLQFTNAAYSLPTASAMMNAPAKAAAKALTRAGWTSTSGQNLVLTEKAANDRRFLMRPNGSLDVVPLAKKELGDVGAVRMNADGTAEADFTWRWIPNELGTLLAPERFAGEQQATATLLWDGTRWTMLKIVKRGA